MGTMKLKRVTGDDALYLKTIDSTVQLFRRESKEYGPRCELAWSEAVQLLTHGRTDLLETWIIPGQVVARI